MSAIMPNPSRSKEVRTLDSVQRRAIPASLKSPSPSIAPSQGPSESASVHEGLLAGLMAIVESALLDTHGSQKAAAIEVGCDPSQLKRQLRLGTVDGRQLAAAGERFLATFGSGLVEAYGAARKTKREIALERVASLQKELSQLQLDLAAAQED